MKIHLLTIAVSILIVPALAQNATDVAAKKTKITSAKITSAEITGKAEQLLHRAYWLDRVEKKRTEALKLYKSFLAAAPDHEAAPRAAAYALALVRRSSRRDAADFQKQYAALLEKVDADVQEEIEDRGRGRGRARGGRGRGFRGRGGRDGGRDRGRGGARDANPLTARMPTRLPDMSREQVTAFLTRYGKVADEHVAELKKTDAKKADALAKSVGDIKALIRAGKLADAQNAIDKMQRSLR